MTTIVNYSDSFISQVDAEFNYLRKKVGSRASSEWLTQIMKRFETKVKPFPLSCPRCDEAMVLGYDNYYEYIDAKSQCRLIYRFNEQVTALLFIRTRQDLRDQLFQLVLMSP